MFKKRVFIISLAIVLGLATVYTLNRTSSSGSFTEISLRNPIPAITTGQTPLFVAQKKGFFNANGLNMTLEQGSRELNPIKMVAAGQNDFGMMGGIESLIIARSKGIKVKAIATLHRNSNFVCLVTLKDSGLTTLADLDDKRVGFFYGHISTDVLRPLFKKEGVNVTEVNVGFDYNQLLSGQIDAQWAFTVRAALLLPSKGHEINIIRPQDYGVQTHGYTIFAMEDFIEKNPETVENFLKSLIQGVDYSLENPVEAVDVLLDINDSLDRDFALQSQKIFDSVTSHSDQYPIGYMDRDMFLEAYNRLNAEGLIENEFDVGDLFMTAYLERAHGNSP